MIAEVVVIDNLRIAACRTDESFGRRADGRNVPDDRGVLCVRITVAGNADRCGNDPSCRIVVERNCRRGWIIVIGKRGRHVNWQRLDRLTANDYVHSPQPGKLTNPIKIRHREPRRPRARSIKIKYAAVDDVLIAFRIFDDGFDIKHLGAGRCVAETRCKAVVRHVVQRCNGSHNVRGGGQPD